MKKLVIPILLVLTSLPAIGKDPSAPAKALAEGNNRFALDLYAALRDRPGNRLVSPYSVETALAMVHEGARGETAAQMAKVLGLPDDPAAAYRALAAALVPGTVEEDGKEIAAYETRVANRVWVQDGLDLVPAFATAMEGPFGAPVGRIDFRETEKARAAINGWVAEHTNDRIRDIVPPDLPTPDTLLALANAIWFRAAWAEPFENRWTKEAPFTTAAGAEVAADLMHRNGQYPYADAGDARLVEIPYRGGETSMVVVLPKAKDGLPALEKGLDAKKLAAWLDRLSGEAVDLRLPRFSFTADYDLSTVLPGMGMKDAFTAGAADFSGITTKEPLFVGPVLHKAFIAVDEAGTEAAAATVVMMLKGGMPENPVVFTADHPFLFLIRHRATGTILFLGRVTNPTAD